MTVFIKIWSESADLGSVFAFLTINSKLSNVFNVTVFEKMPLSSQTIKAGMV